MKDKVHATTTFQLSHALHTKLKLMCHLTDKTMGEFIRISIMDKIKSLNIKKDNMK